MLGLKLCPKCKGDLYLDNDLYDWFVVCLQCGHRTYLGPQKDYQAAMILARSLFRLATNYPESSDTQIAVEEQVKV